MIRCLCLVLMMSLILLFVLTWNIPKENEWVKDCMMDTCLCTNTSTKGCLWVYESCQKSWMANNILRTSIQIVSLLGASCVILVLMVVWENRRRPVRVMEMTEENPAE